ncbi:MAG: mRNA-degrading endonuclease RelE of RelBE toxin-antitoxin system [Verrucomicrobiales bacterium]|jgi:mRNA-degrading endonuclease RelE of RelBE toxin-antitoxin system
MRPIVFHRRAARQFRRIPEERRKQIKAKLREVAALADPTSDPHAAATKGKWEGCLRLRVGDYRAIFWVVERENSFQLQEVLEVLQVGPRGGIY